MEKTELDELEETIREAKAKLKASYKKEEEESEEEMDEASCGDHKSKTEAEHEDEEEVTEAKSKTEAEHEDEEEVTEAKSKTEAEHDDMEEEEEEEVKESLESSVRKMRAEARKSKTEAEHEDEEEVTEGKHSKTEAEHDDDENLEEGFFTAAAAAAVGFLGVIALYKGGKWIKRKAGDVAWELVQKQEAEKAAEKIKAKEDLVADIAKKFENDDKLLKMYKDLPAYTRYPKTKKAEADNKERTNGLSRISKYIKSNLTDEEAKYFSEISKLLRDTTTESTEFDEISVCEMRAKARKSKTEAEHEDDMEEEEEEMKEASLQDMVKDIITRTDVKLEAKKVKEEDEDEDDVEEVEESIEELIALDNSLSEEFKSKAAIVFEAAVSEKVSAQFEELKGEYEESIREEVELKMEGIVNKVDEYLTYAIEQFVESHEETVEVQLRNEITESFINGLKDVFESHYIEMPEGRFDMYADISEKAESMEESLKEATEALTEATEELLVLKRQKIIAEASDDLYDTQAERLVKLTENLEFTDEENFAHKVQVVKETYFNNNGKSEDEETNETSNPRVQERVRIVEEEEKSELNSVMGKYVDALNRHTKNQ